MCRYGRVAKPRARRSLPPLSTSPHPDDASYGCSARDNVIGKPSAESRVDSESKKALDSRFRSLESKAVLESATFVESHQGLPGILGFEMNF